MVGITCSKFILVLLVLTVRPDFSWGADDLCMQGDSHSLHYDFNISVNEQPWCMFQGQMDGENFLLNECGSNKVIPMNFLRDEGKATDSCKVMRTTLNDMPDKIKLFVPYIKQLKYPDGAPFTLQVRMTCLCKADGNTSGSLEFLLGGERFLTFDSETEEFRADNSLGEWLIKMLKNDETFEYLKDFFKKTLKGDCKELLKCLVLWKKELETTAASTTANATVPSKATTNTHIIWIYPVILTCATIVAS